MHHFRMHFKRRKFWSKNGNPRISKPVPKAKRRSRKSLIRCRRCTNRRQSRLICSSGENSCSKRRKHLPCARAQYQRQSNKLPRSLPAIASNARCSDFKFNAHRIRRERTCLIAAVKSNGSSVRRRFSGRRPWELAVDVCDLFTTHEQENSQGSSCRISAFLHCIQECLIALEKPRRTCSVWAYFLNQQLLDVMNT